MKVFEFLADGYRYAIAEKTEQGAKDHLQELVSVDIIESVTEIPESKWDEKIIEMHEDNDVDSEAFFISIRDIMCGEEPQLIYTNDSSLTD